MTTCTSDRRLTVSATLVLSYHGSDTVVKPVSLLQATQGTCTTKKPGAFDFVGKAKWEAWNSLGDLSKVEQWCMS